MRTPDGRWLGVPAEPGVLVCNIGDMLDKLTEGRYRSTPHRVRNTSGTGRLSFPYFFDPSWDATVVPLPLDGSPPADDSERRWDGASVHAWTGTYGDYLTAKVAKVFPDLFASSVVGQRSEPNLSHFGDSPSCPTGTRRWIARRCATAPSHERRYSGPA